MNKKEIYETHVTLGEAFKLVKDTEIKEGLQELIVSEVITIKQKWSFDMLIRISVAAVFILGTFYTIM